MSLFTEPKIFVDEINVCVGASELKDILIRVVPNFTEQTQYKITKDSEWNHEYGNGGYNRFENTLLKEGRPILVSLQNISWITTCDDWFDYDNEEVQKTFLIEEDEIARIVFETIKSSRDLRH